MRFRPDVKLDTTQVVDLRKKSERPPCVICDRLRLTECDHTEPIEACKSPLSVNGLCAGTSRGCTYKCKWEEQVPKKTGSTAAMMEGPLTRMVVREKGVSKPKAYRQVGWLVFGGERDGEFLPWPTDPIQALKGQQVGGYSPVYINATHD